MVTPHDNGEPPEQEVALEEIGHPRGTLAIVAIYGALFALGWTLLYVFEFLARGAPTP